MWRENQQEKGEVEGVQDKNGNENGKEEGGNKKEKEKKSREIHPRNYTSVLFYTITYNIKKITPYCVLEASNEKLHIISGRSNSTELLVNRALQPLRIPGA